MSEMTLDSAVEHVSRSAYRSYSTYVDYEDVESEVRLYSLERGEKLQGALGRGDSFKVVRALWGAARRYCEAEKAQQLGYHPDDVHYYTASTVYEALPVALDAGWDGLLGASEDDGSRLKTPTFASGTYLATVFDIRAALDQTGMKGSVGSFDPDTIAGKARLELLVDSLNTPTTRRPVMTNQQATALTSQQGG